MDYSDAYSDLWDTITWPDFMVNPKLHPNV